MIAGMFNGLSRYTETFGFISRHRLWAFVLIPGFLSTMLIGILIGAPVWGFIFQGGEEAVEHFLIDKLPFKLAEGIAADIITMIPFWMVILVVMAGMLFFVGKYIILVMSGPFMVDLSRRVEEIITGRKIKDEGNFIKDFFRGLAIALRNFLLETIISLFLLLLNLIPVLGNMAAFALTFLVQSYFAGAGNMDFMLERKRFTIGQSIAWTRNHRGLTIGNGMGFLLIFFIPVIGWFLAASYGCIAATMVMIDRFEKEGISVG